MFRSFLVVLFLFCQLLTGEEDLSDSSFEYCEKDIPIEAPEADKGFSLVDLSASPIPRVFGSVNVITGNWVDQEIHDEVTGPDPYSVAHSYVTNNVEKGSLADGWDLFHPTELTVIKPPPRLGEIEYDDSTKLVYREAGGGNVLFKRKPKHEHFVLSLEGSGYTFVSSISNPDRRNIHRTKVEKCGKQWIVTLGDGTRRVYEKKEGKDKQYQKAFHIVEESLPSGNVRHFCYHKDDLTKITTVSSHGKHVINIVTFVKKGSTVDVATSDGMTTSFCVKEHKKKSMVHKVSRPGRSDIDFAYDEGRVHQRLLGSGRKEYAYFYHRGENHLGDKKIHVSDKNEFLVNRVKSLHTKSLPGDSKESLFSFFYRKYKNSSFTDVYEPGGTVRKYMWDINNRPRWVFIRDKEGKQIRDERFSWTKKGELSERVLYGEGKKPMVARTWIRDAARNVVKETYRGIFTGRPAEPFRADKDHNPSGGELIEIRATYDAKGQKTGESDALGNWTYYEYAPGRSLMTARFTCDQTAIIKREFFTYDMSGICTESLVDDGSSRNKDDWKGVHRRLIHRINVRRESPHYGEPLEEAWYTSVKKGEEVLLNKETYKRNKKGLATQKILFDNRGRKSKVWKYTYDNVHRLTQSVDPTGRVETFSYDSHGRLHTKESPEGKITYTYDLFDRVIEETTVFPDRSTASLCRSYDLLGREVQEVDFRGRTTTTSYDPLFRCTKKVDPKFNGIEPTTTFLYNLWEETAVLPSGATVVKRRSSFGKPLEIENPFGAKLQYFYDLKGRLVERRDATSLQTFCEYDALDRPVHVYSRADGQRMDVWKKYRGFDLVEVRDDTKACFFEYDNRGRKISEKTQDLLSGKSFTVRTEYDTLNRPCKIIRDEVVEELSYDLADRVIEKKVIGLDGTVISRTTKKYDLAGRVIEEGVSRCGKMAITKQSFGAYGLVSSIKAPDGTETKFFYTPIKDSKILLSEKKTVDP